MEPNKNATQELRVRLEELIAKLPEQGNPEYDARPSESAKYITSLINEKVAHNAAVLQARVTEDGPTLQDYATARGYDLGAQGITRTPKPAAEATPVAQDSSGLSVLERAAQRRMQEAAASGQDKPAAPPVDSGQKSLVLKRIREADHGVGYAAKLRNKLTRQSGNGGFGAGSASNGQYHDDQLLREMLAEKIKVATGQGPYSANELITLLKSDGYLMQDTSAHSISNSDRMMTTHKAYKNGLLPVFRTLGIQVTPREHDSVLAFSQKELYAKLEQKPYAFISLYQKNADLDSHDVVRRLENQHHIVSGQHGTINVMYIKTTEMEDALKAQNVNIGHGKQGTMVPRNVIFALLKDKPRAFNALLKDAVKLLPEEIVQGLVQRELLYRIKVPGESSELRVRTEEAARALEVIGVVTEHRRGGGMYVQETSLDNALGKDISAKNRALKGIATSERKFGEAGQSR